jgi:lipopolysaccharide biosynthesis glycosyltransferase
MRPLPVFIGFDEAEPVAFHVCAESIIRNSSMPVSIVPLYEKQLHFTNPQSKDGYKQSNSFIYTRFLVPEMAGFKGLALFIDGDMVVEGDISDLFFNHQYGKAIHVVKHDYKPRFEKKYLGATNEAYPRKNWSSVMLFECEHFKNRRLTQQFVEKQSGEYLHRLQWLDNEDIGELPKEWNTLVGEENQTTEPPKLIHYTNGMACWPEWRHLGYAENYDKYHALATDFAGQL